MDHKQHWDAIYRSRTPEELSWFQSRPGVSLDLIAAAGIGKDEAIVDVGGGASTLVDHLLAAGFTRPSVLDISPAALEQARRRLGSRAHQVEWFEADVAGFNPPHRFKLWHDRAVFHFLTSPSERRAYSEALQRTLTPGGFAILATFALDGPEQCSGLPVLRYDSAGISSALGGGFSLRDSRREVHRTPQGALQSFNYFLLVYDAPKVRS